MEEKHGQNAQCATELISMTNLVKICSQIIEIGLFQVFAISSNDIIWLSGIIHLHIHVLASIKCKHLSDPHI